MVQAIASVGTNGTGDSERGEEWYMQIARVGTNDTGDSEREDEWCRH